MMEKERRKERLTILYVVRLIDEGKGERGVAKKSAPKPYKFLN